MSTSHVADKSRTDQERFPELFNDGPSIDRSKCKREVPMKVLVLGLMRTGTLSMKAALETLGIQEVYHMVSVMHDPDDSKWWKRATDAKYKGKGIFGRKEWDQLLGNCQAVCDTPPAMFGPELVAAYPEAKVVLLNRDVDSWYKSCSNTVFQGVDRMPLVARIILWLDWDHMGQTVDMVRGLNRNFFGIQGTEYENAKKKYNEHYETIRKIVPKDNLLEFKVQDGWAPLCDLLNMQKPDMPFPRINEGESFDQRRRLMMKKMIGRVIQKYAYYVVLVLALCMGSLGIKFLQWK